MYRKLNEQLQTVAETELNENSNRIQDDLEHIRLWIRKQSHLNFEIEDQLILSFLRCSKFSLERAKERIDNYYTMRTLSPESYANRDPFLPEIQTLLNTGVILPLPNPLYENGPKIILFTFGNNLNPDTMISANVIKLICMVLDILVREDDICVVSGVYLWSICKNLSVKYAAQITPVVIKRCTTVLQNGIPFRIKKIVVTECPSIFQYVYDVAKLFFNKKLSQRMSMHSHHNTKEFYEKIPPLLFPKELGGSNGSVKELTAEWKAKVESHRDWFLTDEKLKSNENLRKGAPRTKSDMFGTEGSFKMLSID